MTLDPRPFKLSIRSGEFAHAFARLYIDGHEYPKEIPTLCQRDPLEENVVDCFVAPPIGHGPCEMIIYAKTPKDTEYQATLCVQLSYLNIPSANVFPQVYPPFKDNQYVLVEPLRRSLKKDEDIDLHMVIPEARQVKIRNGDDELELDGNEYQGGVLKKTIQVQGNLIVCGQWNKNEDSPICDFQIE